MIPSKFIVSALRKEPFLPFFSAIKAAHHFVPAFVVKAQFYRANVSDLVIYIDVAVRRDELVVFGVSHPDLCARKIFFAENA